MAGVMNLCRVSIPKIYSNLCSSSRNGTSNLLHINACLSRSNSIFNIGNSVRWSLLRTFTYSTTTKSPTNDNQSSHTAASQIAQDLLSAKIKEDAKQESSSETEADEKRRLEEQENARRALRFSFIAFGVMIAGIGGTLIYRWGSPPEDEDGNPLEDELSHMPIVEQYLRRTHRELRVMNRMIQEPSRDKLLPDTLSGQYIQPPYTLVMEMRDVLVHPEWTYQTGWRFKKRPGIEFLLQHCAPPLFEIVIYTNEQGFTAFPVIDKLDPNGIIWYRLFKDSTHYVDGKHIKELNCLNRDLRKVIMVDWDGGAVSCARNQLRVPRWDGNMQDKGLVQLAMLLRTIAESEVEDVREVLDYYRQHPDPLSAFTRFQKEAMEQDQLREQESKLQVERTAKAAVWSPSFLKKWL